MFPIAHKIAVAAFLVGAAPLTVMAEPLRTSETTTMAPSQQTTQRAMPSQTSDPAPWRMRSTTTQPAQQQQISEVSPAMSRDLRALEAPKDRNWVFRDPRLEP